MPGDVADHHDRALAGHVERVVPVAADVRLLQRGHVPDGDLDVGRLRRLGEEAALQRLREQPRRDQGAALGRPHLDVPQRLRALRGERGEQRALVTGDLALLDPGDGERPEQPVLDEQRQRRPG
ncbi:hypothetical protein GCM10025868_21380 [Angustibacter aerolatus]|uniref:Uncharacterized protein n=1 Tax=Angustibacter aerolatus TaxID=1162965 RepID=A0ABQ6JFC0_9ACTN|nr:hypothetical protein GCM10025868_21380 [Angustibacter aerolatus]